MSYNKYRKVKGTKTVTKSALLKSYISLINFFPKLNKKLYYILQLPERSKILDVGAGTGSFLRVVNALRPDLELHALDVTSEGFKQIEFPCTCHVGDGLLLPFADDTFDYVISQHVLEHVSDSALFIGEIARVTRQYAVVVTPNHITLRLFGKANFRSDPTHVRPYNTYALGFLVEQTDMNILYSRNEKYVNIPRILLLFLFPYYLRRKNLLQWFLDMICKRGAVIIARK